MGVDITDALGWIAGIYVLSHESPKSGQPNAILFRDLLCCYQRLCWQIAPPDILNSYKIFLFKKAVCF